MVIRHCRESTGNMWCDCFLMSFIFPSHTEKSSELFHSHSTHIKRALDSWDFFFLSFLLQPDSFAHGLWHTWSSFLHSCLWVISVFCYLMRFFFNISPDHHIVSLWDPSIIYFLYSLHLKDNPNMVCFSFFIVLVLMNSFADKDNNKWMLRGIGLLKLI